MATFTRDNRMTYPFLRSFTVEPKSPMTPAMARCMYRPDDELRTLRSCLRWMCLDQSDTPRAIFSWSVFFLLAVAVPAVSHFVLSFRPNRRPYDLVVQLSLTAEAALSFLTLSAVTRRYGLRRFLFLDKLSCESDRVRREYTARVGRSFRLLSLFVLPCFAAEAAHKLWWYIASSRKVPFWGNPLATDCVACALELASWIYRTANFFLVCVLFRLICHLQILRLQDFAAVFERESDVAVVLRDHLRVQRQLKVISHRFRGFILWGLIMVTASQLAATVITLRPSSDDNLFNTGELAICSVVLVSGLLICLGSAARITHKAQALTSHAAKWHVCATIDDSVLPVVVEEETPAAAAAASSSLVNSDHNANATNDEDDDSYLEEQLYSQDDDDLDLEATKIVKPHVHTITFQKRQALVTYLENNRAGITVFGFTVDRGWLQAVFMLQMTLFLWVFSKTIGIS